MIKYILLLCLLVGTLCEPSPEEINAITIMHQNVNTFKCKGVSPFFEIKYGYEKISELSGVSFCFKQSQRTCCNQDNFDQLRLEWFKFIYNTVELSAQCQSLMNEVLCSECDADIGQGLRKGMCSHVCQKLYSACFEDYFKLEPKSNRLRLCQQNDLLCSKLKFIIHKSDDFCTQLGFDVNANYDYSEWADDLLFNNTQGLKAPCYDAIPSSKYWGPAKLKAGNYSHEKFSEKVKDKMQKTKDAFSSKMQWLNYVLYISVGVLGSVIIGIVWWIYRQSHPRGVRIGGNRKKIEKREKKEREKEQEKEQYQQQQPQQQGRDKNKDD